jgi:hypothetical protein
LIDELDANIMGNEDLRAILDSGHRRKGKVTRNVLIADQSQPRRFSTYAATAFGFLASRVQLPDTIADRSIFIDLKKRLPDEKRETLRAGGGKDLDLLARKIVRWANDNAERIAALDPEMPPTIFNRDADNWATLFAIADVAGGPWPERLRTAALQRVVVDDDATSLIELLLTDIRNIFSALKVDEITSADLIERLCAIMPRPWSEYGKTGKAITQNRLARLLKPLAIGPELVTPARLAGYRLARFEEAFARYLGSGNLSTSPNPITTGVSDLFATSLSDDEREVSKSQKSNNDGLKRGREVAEGGNGYARANRFTAEALTDICEWYVGALRRRHGEPGLEAALDQALRERLFNKYDVAPAELETAVDQVMKRLLDPL